MKKVFLFGALALFAAGTIFTVTSCDEDNPISCTKKYADLLEAQTDYIADPSSANCNAYKDALEDYVGCDGITDKATWQAVLDELSCD